MKATLLALSIAGLILLHALSGQVEYVSLQGIESHAGQEVVTSGIAKGKRLCSDECIALIGANKSGPVTVRGSVVKTGGKVRLFVRRIE
ncbi:hypothetical protein HY571_00995 [Candidatus Micrarchaeota archaeon]|nr:hypothetical protein [Candidatus Micrarchaeota archaeon]